MGLKDTIKIVVSGDSAGASKALASARKDAGKTGHSFGSMAKVAAGGFVALAAGAVAMGVAAVKAAETEQTAHAKLLASLKAAHQAWGTYKDGVEAADKAGEKFGYTTADTESALAQGVTSAGSMSKALRDLSLAQNIVALKGGDLSSAMTAVAKASEGQLRPLKALGIDLPVAAGGALKTKTAYEALLKAQQDLQDTETKLHETRTKAADDNAGKVATAEKTLIDLEQRLSVKKKISISDEQALARAKDAVTRAQQLTVPSSNDLAKAQQKVAQAQGKLNDTAHAGDKIITALSQKVKGQASAAAQTFAGKTKALQAQWEDFQATLGNKIIPYLLILMQIISRDLPPFMDRLGTGWVRVWGDMKTAVVDVGNTVVDVINGIRAGARVIEKIHNAIPGVKKWDLTPNMAQFSDGINHADPTAKKGKSGTVDQDPGNFAPGYGPNKAKPVPKPGDKNFYGPVETKPAVQHVTIHMHAQPTPAMVNATLRRYAKRNGSRNPAFNSLPAGGSGGD